MSEEQFESTKAAVLDHINKLFEQMESDVALSHQEKYALLEDAFEQATDSEELRVAFDQWYKDHANELDLEHEPDELWDQAVNGSDDDGDYDW